MVSVFQPLSANQHQSLVGADHLYESWRSACDGLSTQMVIDARQTTDPTADVPVWTANGYAHDVSISLIADEGRNVRTQYEVRLDAPQAPRFSLTRRTGARPARATTTGDDRFDDAVLIATDDRAALRTFLTPERRLAIMDFLLRMPEARVTHDAVLAWSNSVDQDEMTVSQMMRPLLSVADTVRPSWVDVALDERSVVHDLFETGHDLDGMTQRFNELYLANEVSWTGEVLEVGAVDRVGRRVALFIGTSSGAASSGRIVALAATDPSADILKGDIITVTGALWKLDPQKRFFYIE